MPPISGVTVIPSEERESRDPFDSAFGLAQDKPMRPESARFYQDPMDPSARAKQALGRDDNARAGYIPPLQSKTESGGDKRPAYKEKLRASL